MISRRLARVILLFGVFLCTSLSAQETGHSTAIEAQKILEQRCMVCHGCYDAPCQLKLEAHEGLTRGASKDLVYDSTRLLAGNLTRLFDDGLTNEQWRSKGFYPVLADNKAERGVMHRMLQLKQKNPLPVNGQLPDGFDFSLYRDQQCPKQNEFDQFAEDYPLWGMPYGLPGLRPEQHQTLIDWIEQGAPPPPKTPLSAPAQSAVAQWEKFLNGSSNKQKLMSRYIFEHLFLASIYFEENNNPIWFRMVRSHTKPGTNIGLIASRRPYDDPGTSEFYYRLQRMPVSALSKRHMPYLFDQKRMDFYSAQFLSADYEVGTLPGYDSKLASNPFKSFQQIPVEARYRFLLREAHFSIMNFIKGPVCRGQVALNVIDEHFWVMFVNPDLVDTQLDADFLARESENLHLPSSAIHSVIDLFAWRKYAKSEARYKQAKVAFLEKEIKLNIRINDENSIWDGEGSNDSAALTIFRHFDTASVVKGFVGSTPKTAWVIGYPLLERIHYLLVAGFDVYGSASHQLVSRLYMDFLRMDGEFNFLMYMPPESRETIRGYWYRDARRVSKADFFGDTSIIDKPTAIQYTTDDPKAEFLARMRDRIFGAKADAYDYHIGASPAIVRAFTRLETNIGKHNEFMPQVSFVNVIGTSRDQVFTVIRNTGYSNIAQLFKEKEREIPQETNLTVVRGFIGAYPNYFFQVAESQVELFARDVAAMSNKSDYEALLNHYGVRRNSPWFWDVSDKFHQMQKVQDPINAGLMDYNRYHGH